MADRKPRPDRLAATPAPRKDRIVGSGRNRVGSARSVTAGAGIDVDAATEAALTAKVKKHNEQTPEGRRTSLRTLKAVYRRGAGAFSVSHRPGMTRGQWAMGRVNAFLKMLRSGRPDNANYVNDNDLLPRDHPWRTKGAEPFAVKAAGTNSTDDMGVPTRRQAARVARMIGCQGAHQHDDGTWMPCATHDEMLSTLEMTKSRKRRQRRGYGAPPPRRFEQLIERGVRGIDTLPGGGLVSAPISAKAGMRGPLGGNRRMRRRARWLGPLGRQVGATRAARRFERSVARNDNAPDADDDGIIQEGTIHERPKNPFSALQQRLRTRKRRAATEAANWAAELRKANEPDGGFTLRMGGISPVKSGWAVARNGDGIVIPRSVMFDRDGEPTDEGVDLLKAFIRKYKEPLFGVEDNENRTVTLGLWHNPSTGMLHVDVTDVFSKDSMTREQAEEMGRRRDQISIADLDRISAGDYGKDTFPETGGSGGNVIDLDSFQEDVMRRRSRRGRKKPFRPSQETRVAKGPDDIDMILTGGVKELAAKHGEERDWHDIVAVEPDRRREIADFYDAAPDLPADEISGETREAFEAFATEIEEQYAVLTEELGVTVEFVDFDPYANFLEMRDDFLTNKRLQIMRTAVTGSHPFLSDEQNDKFRAVHDAFGHLATGRGFDRHGEEAAYQAHQTMFSKTARKALATETRGQNQYLLDRGEFGPQKLVLLPEEMMKALRAWLVVLVKAFAAGVRKAQRDSDRDNLYSVTGSHHVTGGRVPQPNRTN